MPAQSKDVRLHRRGGDRFMAVSGFLVGARARLESPDVRRECLPEDYRTRPALGLRRRLI
jgi:hypothetical protein